MLRIGVWMMVFGFGSLLLALVDAQFILLAWADKLQPWFGTFLGTAGALIIVAALIGDKADDHTNA